MAASGKVQETAAIHLGDLLDARDGNAASAVVMLVAGETRLVAHRAVVAARSPALQRKIEANRNKIFFPDLDGRVLSHLLTYCYTLQPPQLPSIAPDLLVAADRYRLLGLKAHCEQQLIAQLSVETAADTAILALRHCCNNLKQAAIAFIKASKSEVFATRGWTDAVQHKPKVAARICHLLAKASAETSAPGAPAAAQSQLTADTLTQPDTGRSQTPVSTAAVSQPTTTAQSQHDSGHHQSPAAAVPPTPPRHTPQPDDSSTSHLRNLSSQQKCKWLMLAVKKGKAEEVEALLEAGANVGVIDRDGNMALHCAAKEGYSEVVRCLLKGGAEVNAREAWRQSTPLHLAAQNGHVAVVRLLVEASADLNARDLREWTPLHCAASCGHTEATDVLLEAGANRGAREKEGRTPLELARLHNKQQVSELLM